MSDEIDTILDRLTDDRWPYTMKLRTAFASLQAERDEAGAALIDCRVTLDEERASNDKLQAERDEALDRIDVLARRHEEDEAYRVKANEERDAALARVEALEALLEEALGRGMHDHRCGLVRHAGSPCTCLLGRIRKALAAPPIDAALGGKG